MAKNSAGAAFLNSKKKLEERLAARESGLELDSELKENDVFGLQHHHLLTCLEKTTEREFVEMDMPYNGAANKPSNTPPLTPSPSITSVGERRGGCCARRPSHRRYQATRTTSDAGQEEMNDIQIRLPSFNRTSRSSLNVVTANPNVSTPINTARPNNASNVTTAIVSMPSSHSAASELEAVIGGNVQQNPSVVRISTL